jgi:hypothetical protein
MRQVVHAFDERVVAEVLEFSQAIGDCGVRRRRQRRLRRRL